MLFSRFALLFLSSRLPPSLLERVLNAGLAPFPPILNIDYNRLRLKHHLTYTGPPHDLTKATYTLASFCVVNRATSSRALALRTLSLSSSLCRARARLLFLVLTRMSW